MIVKHITIIEKTLISYSLPVDEMGNSYNHKNPGCETCGDFIGQLVKQGKTREKTTPEEMEDFD